MSVRRVLASVVVSVLLAGGLAACGGDEPEPGARPKLPASESPSPTPTPTATDAKETPEEFIRRWIAVSDAMQVSGETAEFLAMGSNCEGCSKLATRVADIYSGGGFIRTDGMEVTRIRKTGTGAGQIVFDLDVNAAPTRIRESATGPDTRMPGGKATLRIRLKQTRPWRVVDITTLAS